jgi:DNA primase catalytic subunit
MGIHYDYKSTRGMRAMEKQAKREKKLAEKRAKKEIKEGKKERETDNRIDVQEPITLDFITNPNKDK